MRATSHLGDDCMFFRAAISRLIGAIALLVLGGCATTSTLYSNTFVKPSGPVSRLNVLYIESNLVFKGTNTTLQFYDIGYTDLPELLRERVPIVFGLNGIEAECEAARSRDLARQWANNKGNSMLLTLQIIDGQVVSGSHTPRTTSLNLQANLIDPATRLRQWTGQFRNTFVAPPAGKNGFDNAFVDHMLKIVLEQLARDGIVRLPDDRAKVPESKPAASAPANG